MKLTTKILLASWVILCAIALNAKFCRSIPHGGATGGYNRGYEDGLKAGELGDKHAEEKEL